MSKLQRYVWVALMVAIGVGSGGAAGFVQRIDRCWDRVDLDSVDEAGARELPPRACTP